MNDKSVMTLGIFAHANAGKTTITEQLLYHTNVKRTRGRVDNGDTTTDNLKVERERGISVRASLVTLPLSDRNVQLIDTPGHIDFSAEVERAISVLDGAILVVSGVEGVEPQTQVIWRILRERNIPTLIFINKMDRMGADYDRVLAEMQSKLSTNIIPIVKVKKEQNDILSYKDIKIENVVEELAKYDDNILEKYLNDEKISREWLEEQVRSMTQSGTLFLVYGGSALLDEGMYRLIDGISTYLPTAAKSKSPDFTGYIYTVKRDIGVRELYVKVLNGELENRYEFNIDNGLKQKVRTITKLDGTKRIRTEKLETGEIGIITGIDAKCGDLIGKPISSFKPVSFVNPLFHTSVTTNDSSNIHELVNALEVLNDEDPSLNLQYNKNTGQISVDLMGNLQSEIIANMLKERFQIDAVFSDPTLIHRETPISVGKGECTFDRVSAVEFEISPLPTGSGLHYSSKVSTDYLFTKYQKQIEKLVKMYSKQGLYGWEVTDAMITLIGGKSDSVCSDPSHFNVAVPLAFMRALKNAGMQLEEPMMKYEITTPNENFRQVLSSVSSLGVEYEKIINLPENTIIPGNAPLASMIDLPTIITRLTGGHGSLIKKPYGYQLCSSGELVEKQVIGRDPRNETLFLMDMGCSIEHIDRSKRK